MLIRNEEQKGKGGSGVERECVIHGEKFQKQEQHHRSSPPHHQKSRSSVSNSSSECSDSEAAADADGGGGGGNNRIDMAMNCHEYLNPRDYDHELSLSTLVFNLFLLPSNSG